MAWNLFVLICTQFESMHLKHLSYTCNNDFFAEFQDFYLLMMTISL